MHITDRQTHKTLLEKSIILIVEDNQMQRFMLRQIFENAGFEHIYEAKDGKEGWEKTKILHPDLVLLDMNMPVMDGFSYCAKARKDPAFQQLTILAQTGLTELEDKARIFQAGVTDYVTKPIDFHEIEARSFIHLERALHFKELKVFNERVSRELASARALIEASLPDTHTLESIKENYRIDIGAIFKSSNEMGGDFWGCYPVSPHQLALYAVDISGHGIDSALSALRIHSMLHAQAYENIEPSEVLAWLNEKLIGLFPMEQFSTMFYGIIDTNDAMLHYAVAATTAPILLHHNSTNPQLLSGKGYPLGILNNATFKTEHIPLHKGSSLLLYSDGLTEAENKHGKMLQEEGLLRLLGNINYKSLTAQETLDKLMKQFTTKYGKELNDDLTINLYTILS